LASTPSRARLRSTGSATRFELARNNDVSPLWFRCAAASLCVSSRASSSPVAQVRRPLGPHFNSPNVWYHETSKEEPPCLYDDDECGGYGGDCAQGFFGACGARICYMNCSKFVCCCMCSRLITRCCAACPSPIVSSGLSTPAFPWSCCDSVYTLCSEECRPIVCCPCICFGSLEGPSGGGNQPGATFGAGWGETTHKPFGHQM